MILTAFLNGSIDLTVRGKLRRVTSWSALRRSLKKHWLSMAGTRPPADDLDLRESDSEANDEILVWSLVFQV